MKRSGLFLLGELEDAATSAARVSQIGLGLDQLDATLVLGFADGQADGLFLSGLHC